MAAEQPITRRQNYQPPRQGKRGQFVDAVIILVLVFGALFATTYITNTGGGQGGGSQGTVKPLSQLDLTAAERQQYQKMLNSDTIDLKTINSQVAENNVGIDKYQIPVIPLVITIAIALGYLTFVYWSSFREYREVIAEKFGAPEGDS